MESLDGAPDMLPALQPGERAGRASVVRSQLFRLCLDHGNDVRGRLQSGSLADLTGGSPVRSGSGCHPGRHHCAQTKTFSRRSVISVVKQTRQQACEGAGRTCALRCIPFHLLERPHRSEICRCAMRAVTPPSAHVCQMASPPRHDASAYAARLPGRSREQRDQRPRDATGMGT